MKDKQTTKPQTQKAPINWEAVHMLAREVGAREAARRLGINESTVLSRAKRGEWKLPKRQGGATIKKANAITMRSTPSEALIAVHADLEEETKTGLKQTLAKAVQALAKKQALPVESIAQFKDACLSGAKLFGWDGKPSVTTYYGDDNRQVIVCPPERRQQLIEQRQRLLEAESQGKVIEVNGHKTKAAAPVTPPAPETHSNANVGAGNGIVARNQRPTEKQDPLSQWRDSVGRADTWKTSETENHAGMFGPYPEEYEVW
jgi:hypothetical protein